MNQNIDLYECINKWVGAFSSSPIYKVDIALELISTLISSHKSYNNISFIPSGAKRNKTNISYMEYLNIYILLEDDSISNNTIKFKNSIFELISKNETYKNKVNDISNSIVLEHESEKIILIPSLKCHESNNIEGALVTFPDGTNEIFYPKLDNKNFDKKEHDCGNNFVNLIKIFKHIFSNFASEIKSVNELAPNIVEALIWNLPDNIFKFKSYDEGLLNSIDYIYDTIASDDYMSLSEINDIKVLFSKRNNLHRKEILKALYKIKEFIHENI